MTRSTEMVNVTLPLDIPLQRFRDILCSACEGGTNYWAQVSKLDYDEDLEYNAVTFHELNENETGYVKRGVRVQAKDLAEGLKLAAITAPRHFANFMNENDDAEIADVLVQLTIFREIKYG